MHFILVNHKWITYQERSDLNSEVYFILFYYFGVCVKNGRFYLYIIKFRQHQHLSLVHIVQSHQGQPDPLHSKYIQNWDKYYKQLKGFVGESPALPKRPHIHWLHGKCAALALTSPNLRGSCNHKLKASYQQDSLYCDLLTMLEPLQNQVQVEYT